jgi:polysaccharide export outer membrane protein
MFRDNFSGSSEVIWKRAWVLLPALFVAGVLGQTPGKGGGNDAPDPPKTMPGLNDPSVNNAQVDVASYIIGPNDILNIEVFGEQRWSHPYQVRTDGMITVALIGELKASGLTPIQLQRQLTEAFKSQINEPNVTVSVYDVRSKMYSVTGQVRRPGKFPLIANPTTVFDAINEAGGFADNFADKKHIQIIRGTQRLPFNYEDYVKGKNIDKNIPLQSGDTIIVK